MSLLRAQQPDKNVSHQTLTGSQIPQKLTPWKGLLQLADPEIWVASIVPFSLGTCLAAGHTGNADWTLIVQALVVLFLVETGKNGLNEYFDYLSGADRFVEPVDRTNFSGGKKVIVDHLLTLTQVGWISAITLIAAGVVSIPLVIQKPGLAVFGLLGVFFAAAYSVPPFQLSYRGLGEFAVGLTFGPIVVCGAYYLQTEVIGVEPLLLSIPMGFLIANVLWINQIPDVGADRKANKRNLVARTGREGALSGYVLLFVTAFVSLLFFSILLREPVYLIGLAGFIPAPIAIGIAGKNLLDSQKLVSASALTIHIYLLTGILLCVAALSPLAVQDSIIGAPR